MELEDGDDPLNPLGAAGIVSVVAVEDACLLSPSSCGSVYEAVIASPSAQCNTPSFSVAEPVYVPVSKPFFRNMPVAIPVSVNVTVSESLGHETDAETVLRFVPSVLASESVRVRYTLSAGIGGARTEAAQPGIRGRRVQGDETVLRHLKRHVLSESGSDRCAQGEKQDRPRPHGRFTGVAADLGRLDVETK